MESMDPQLNLQVWTIEGNDKNSFHGKHAMKLPVTKMKLQTREDDADKVEGEMTDQLSAESTINSNATDGYEISDVEDNLADGGSS